MKKQLNLILTLIAICLTGIVIFQFYWALNGYKVNKAKFNADIDVAMQQALDSCKKDYFDSIRVVMVRRLSAPGFKIKIDTVGKGEGKDELYKVRFAGARTGMISPFTITYQGVETYRAKIAHKNNNAELFTEASFYLPALLNELLIVLGADDITSLQPGSLNGLLPKPPFALNSGIYQLPPNYRQADSLKIARYFKKALEQRNIPNNFHLLISIKANLPVDSKHSSYTNEYSYKYHGFTFLHIVGPELFVRSAFQNPQYIVLKGMLLTLVMSLILVLFTAWCFYYVYNIIINQKKLADLKDDFINNMTHELKTPIATISVAIEGLQHFNALNDPEKTQRYLETSRNQLNHLNNLVNKVLNVAAFENKEFDLNFSSVNFDEMMKEIITVEKLKAAKEVHIEFVNHSEISHIKADSVHLRNIFVNLVDNAVKYSNGPPYISINCKRIDNSLEVTVRDKGQGISAANITRVFDKFYRVPSGNVHNVKGTGLGLSYVKYITEAHGGSISVNSTLNEGSEFIVTLPLK